MLRLQRLGTLAVLVGLGGLTSGCATDPEFWEAFNDGLYEVSDQLAWENENCYWSPPPGMPNGIPQQYCPGDYGYRDFYIPPDSPYWRRGNHDGDGHHDGRRRHDGHHDRDRDRDRHRR